MAKVLRFPRINSITISARLTRDPEIRYSNNNMMIAKLGLAFDRLRKDEYGNYQAVANFFDATAFGKQAEFCNDQLHKGSPVVIEGELSINSYTDQSGVNRRFTEVLINRIHLLDREASQGGYGQADDAPVDQYTPKANDEPSSIRQNNVSEDDVPF